MYCIREVESKSRGKDHEPFFFYLQWMVVTLHGDHTATVQKHVEVGKKHDSELARIHLLNMVGKIAAVLDPALQAENAT